MRPITDSAQEVSADDLPLVGLRVLDFTRLLPGSVCTLILADYGAEVLKVEPPGAGDYAREEHPRLRNESMQFLMFNRNKRSVVVNLKTEVGRQIIYELVPHYDVVVESFRPGVTARLGISYDELITRNPSLIYCSISGYGQNGPYRDVPAHDLNIMALAGILDVTGRPGGLPVIPGIPLVDLGPAGVMPALAIVMALLARQRLGRGQYIDAAMLDGAVSWMTQLSFAFAGVKTPARGMLPGAGGRPCYAVYATSDGRHIALAALELKFWENFCRAVRRPDLIPRYEDCSEEMFATLRQIFVERTATEWVALLESVDTCWAPVLRPEEVPQNQQVKARGMIQSYQHPTEGQVWSFAPPLKFAGLSPMARRPAPRMGEHTYEVLRELGHSAEEIETLERRGAVAGPNPVGPNNV